MKEYGTVNILGIKYKVVETDHIQDDYFGSISHPSQVILLWNKASPEAKRVTLIHEVLHAIDKAIGIFPAVGEEDDKETYIDRLAVAFHFVLPDIVRIFKEMKGNEDQWQKLPDIYAPLTWDNSFMRED